MTFDTSDLGSLVSAGTFEAVIRHEMAHLLGFGSLWSSSAVGLPGYQEVYVNGSGQYTGAFGLAAFQQEFDQADATYVPIELQERQTDIGIWASILGPSLKLSILEMILEIPLCIPVSLMERFWIMN